MNRTDAQTAYAAALSIPIDRSDVIAANNISLDYVDKLLGTTNGVYFTLFAADYGVVADAKKLWDVSMSSGTNVIISTSAPFTITDEGKVGKVSRAAAG